MNPSVHGAPEMDHQYIDRHSLAERYLENELPPAERAAFESHLVDCQECRDRLLLAEMFHTRQTDGVPPPPASRLVLRLKPWQLAALAISALLLLAIPALVIAVFLR